MAAELSEFNPKPIPAEQLSKLYQITHGHDLPYCRSKCGHLYYPSVRSFAEHLMWLLGQEGSYDTFEYHFEVLKKLLRVHWLCGVCRNVILSLIPFHSLFPGQDLLYCFDKWRCSLYLTLYRQLYRHSRFPKVMMRACSHSIDQFQSICMLFESLLNASFSSIIDDRLYYDALGLGKILILTVKYWKRKHFEYYLPNHFNTIHKWRLRLADSSVLRPEMERNYTVWTKEDLDPTKRMQLTTEAARKWEMLAIHHLVRDFQWIIRLRAHLVAKNLASFTGNMFDYNLSEITERMEHVKSMGKIKSYNNLCCASTQCSKLERHSRFKLCGGCKMTYYCSRSCQKRAWSNHKENCIKLSHLYQL